MSTHKNIDRVCILVLLLTLLLTAGFMNGEKLGLRAAADEDADGYAGTGYFTENDLDGSWEDYAYTTYITLSGDSAKVSGSGAYAYDGGVVIAGGGWYVLSGTLTDGSITVDAYDSSKVWLRLEGVEVSCSDDACLIIDQADKVFLTLAEGTENRFTSGADYSAAALEDGTGGAIFAHDDLTINGSGSLTVTANYKHGIDANDSLVVTGGTITVTAPQDGIHVNDSFRFRGADLTVRAGDDAIHSDGELYVESGTILIPECYEGLEAVTVHIAGGDVTVYPSDDGINANGAVSGTGGMGPFGGMGGEALPQTETTGTSAETWIRVSGGKVTVINETGRDADGLDSNGSIYIEGGTILVSLPGDGGNNALDYGSESGGELIVTGGTVVACGGSSMAEAFSASSTQCAILYNLDAAAPAGEAFRVLDAAGSEVLSYTPPCAYSSVAFSSPALTLGETYTLCAGEEWQEVTLSEVSTQLGTSGGMGGMGNMGGMGGGMQPGGGQSTGGFTPPEQSGDGAADFSGRPTPPERSGGEDGTMPSGRPGPWGQSGENSGEPAAPPSPPDWDESGESGGEPADLPSPPDMENGDTEAGNFSPVQTEPKEGTESAEAEETSIGTGIWLMLGAAAAVLVVGILLAAGFRKNS